MRIFLMILDKIAFSLFSSQLTYVVTTDKQGNTKESKHNDYIYIYIYMCVCVCVCVCVYEDIDCYQCPFYL